jgi:hypothetical protein
VLIYYYLFIYCLESFNEIKLSLNDFLDFDSIKIYFKSRVFPYTNRMILDITFKFMAGFNMQLIFDYFYVSRKKQWLITYLKNMMCRLDMLYTINIETFYIDFLFFYSFSFFKFFFFTIFFYVLFSWNFVLSFLYITFSWKVWGFLNF